MISRTSKAVWYATLPRKILSANSYVARNLAGCYDGWPAEQQRILRHGQYYPHILMPAGVAHTSRYRLRFRGTPKVSAVIVRLVSGSNPHGNGDKSLA